ncbi:MAG: PilZ domain-containing protein [Spirochaetes bacterium]|nr:PilZ domain-containing protein [Spirochaetota bacterium]
MSSVISKVEKEFIFKFLIQNKIKIEIKCRGESTYATILEQSSKEMKIELVSILEEMLKYNAEIMVFFYFQNNYHTFKSNIIKLQGNIAIIKNPASIAKNLQRKYERVYIKGKLALDFEIKGDLIHLNYPQSKVNYYPNTPPIDADFFGVKIDVILKKFNKKMSTLISMSKIRMLRNYTPTTFEEQIVIKYGRILYIPNVYSEIPQKQLSPTIQILLKSEWVNFEILKNKTQPFVVNKVLLKYLLSIADNGIFSEAIIPVLYRNYVIALIYLHNDLQKKEAINLKILNYSYQFARVLSYALKENGYFKEEEANTQKYNVPIYDLSPGGLAFQHNDDFFEDKLLLNHNQRILIEIDKRPIRVFAKLVRKFQNLTKYCYGFMFIDIKKQDFDFLSKYLYKKN